MVRVSPAFAGRVTILVAGQVAMYYMFKWMVAQFDPNKDRKDAAAAASSKLLQRLKDRNIELTDYEGMVAADVIDPADLTTTWESVGGLDKTIAVLQESVVLPLTRPDLFPKGSTLLRAPRGVLLFGPPGCGKTLLAKALAKEAGCCFISLQPSTFMDKWYGESQKLVDGLFSLASKLKPTIIFIDEIDAFLRKRSSSDQEMNAHMKAQFMQLWDGFSSDEPGHIVIIGATNRPEDVDKAFLRRMPRVCKIGLPGKEQRKSILKALLKDEKIEGEFDLEPIAIATEGYSGCDLQELCRNAAMTKMRERVQVALAEGTVSEAPISLSTLDFINAMSVVEDANSEDDGDGFEDSVVAID
eukprot:m.64537 g.64537  ORF g.64537 m.64537 type:complete len:357 (+) comp23443_c0_seq1:162-1232(+)